MFFIKSMDILKRIFNYGTVKYPDEGRTVELHWGQFLIMRVALTSMLTMRQIKPRFKVKSHFLTLNSCWSFILNYRFLKMMSCDTNYPFGSFGNNPLKDLKNVACTRLKFHKALLLPDFPNSAMTFTENDAKK